MCIPELPSLFFSGECLGNRINNFLFVLHNNFFRLRPYRGPK
jgi:hypothetical protein